MAIFDLAELIQTEQSRDNVYKYKVSDLMNHYNESLRTIDGKLPVLKSSGKGKEYKFALTEKRYVPSQYSAFNEVFDRKGSLKVGDNILKAYLHEGDKYSKINIAESEIGSKFYVTMSDDTIIRYGEGYPVVKNIYK